MSLIAVAVSHLRCYEDANEFTTCLDQCAHSGRASAADPDGGGGQFLLSVLPAAFLPLEPLLFPLVSASAWPLSGHGDAVTLSGSVN